MTRLRAALLATAALTAVLALPAAASEVPADVSTTEGDVCVYVVQHGQPKGYCVRY